MRKLLSFMALIVSVLFVSNARAELHVDIVAGGVDPTSIAVQKFETVGKVSSSDAKMLREVVENDLKRTGLFRIVNHDAFPEFVKMNEMPNFKSWNAIKAQALVQTKLQPEGKDSYKLEFYLWDVNGKEQIEAQSLIASKKSVRRLAHIMADAIYERLT
ncbi:MAG: Tol-Pal system protein TolB, partial [Alphaproteobacteria bacterium]|nr:Tol-Pal system protein TolB [Alphaproteobacteria bacterium]